MEDSRAKDADNHVGEQLKRYRGSLSQAAFGERFGLSHTTISHHERGVRAVEAGRLFQFAEGLGVPIESFFPKQSNTCADDQQEKKRA